MMKNRHVVLLTLAIAGVLAIVGPASSVLDRHPSARAIASAVPGDVILIDPDEHLGNCQMLILENFTADRVFAVYDLAGGCSDDGQLPYDWLDSDASLRAKIIPEKLAQRAVDSPFKVAGRE